MPQPSDDAKRLRANLQGEVDSAALYRALAKAEEKPALKSVYDRLADVEERHATFWQKRLSALGLSSDRAPPGRRARLLSWVVKRFGVGAVLPSLVSLERADSAQYDNQVDAVSGGLPGAERSHARILEAIAGPAPGAVADGGLARLEGRHRGMGGNALRAAVLGANDGLVSNLSLVMGVAGAGAAAKNILLTGLAGLIAGACSMAMGEWLSVNSSRELYQRQIAAEAEELEAVPDEEREELALIYEAKGLPRDQAQALADRLMADKSTALDTLAREELGIDPNELGGSAWLAAITSFGLFACGAAFPVVPFAILSGRQAVVSSVVVSGAAMFAIGAATTIFTGRGMIFSGVRQLAIGAAAAGVTYFAGSLFGAVLQ
ncbi:MAG: rubrerythrin family protein [Rhodospirillaceae bacterium]|nr:MAG: rubrerythrin family protein [Rhodospirillaceae bacterium]